MPPSFQTQDVDPEAVDASRIDYDPENFPPQLDALMADRGRRTGICLLLHGGVREQRQQALGTLARYTGGNVHQFQMGSLLADYRIQTQNNLRKAFDHAAEESALLYFNRADSIFLHDHDDAPDHPEDNAVPTTVEYFLDRVEAHAGIVVLGMQRKGHVERTRRVVHVIVRFG